MIQKKILTMILAVICASFAFATTDLQKVSAAKERTLNFTRNGVNQANSVNNPIFVQPDADGDGVEDFRDNCRNAYNPEKIAFFSARNPTGDIYVINADGTNETRLTFNSVINYMPSFSPDGSKIVFSAYREGYFYDIYVMNADGTNVTRLTENPASDWEPSFSPDGTKIVFRSVHDSGAEIYVMNADGTNQTRLTFNSTEDSDPSFSPDGSKIVFQSRRNGNYEIYVMNADGTNQTRLTNNQGRDRSPTFSPDGTKIAFSSQRDGIFDEIYVMNSDGTNETRLTFNSTEDQNPAFSPDGTKIAYQFNPGNNINWEIRVMNADGTNPTRLTNNLFNMMPSWGRQADSDGDGIGDACENTAPTINVAAVNIAQNSALPSQPIAEVSDIETAAEDLTVSVVGATPNGIIIENIGINSNGEVTADVAASCSAVLGENIVALQVSDGTLTSTANLIVNVAPSNPAVISLKPFSTLSPPNHKLQTFTVGQMAQSAIDDCGGNLIGNVTIEKATSDEAADDSGSGNTEQDIITGADCRSIQLRSERSGSGNGRVYTVTLKVVDSSGNTTRADYKVFVPKGNQTAIENAAAYTVNSGCF